MICKKAKGVTIVEVLISVAILGGVVAMSTLGIKMLNLFNRQRILAETETEAQRLMYMIERDIRNSYVYAISYIDPADPEGGGNGITLQTQEFLADGTTYDQNLGTLLNMPEASITYQYLGSAGKEYLKRRLSKGNEDTEQRFLTNALDLSSPIFKPMVGYEGVRIELNLTPAYRKGNSKKTYSTSVMKYFNFKN